MSSWIYIIWIAWVLHLGVSLDTTLAPALKSCDKHLSIKSTPLLLDLPSYSHRERRPYDHRSLVSPSVSTKHGPEQRLSKVELEETEQNYERRSAIRHLRPIPVHRAVSGLILVPDFLATATHTSRAHDFSELDSVGTISLLRRTIEAHGSSARRQSSTTLSSAIGIPRRPSQRSQSPSLMSHTSSEIDHVSLGIPSPASRKANSQIPANFKKVSKSSGSTSLIRSIKNPNSLQAEGGFNQQNNANIEQSNSRGRSTTRANKLFNHKAASVSTIRDATADGRIAENMESLALSKSRTSQNPKPQYTSSDGTGDGSAFKNPSQGEKQPGRNVYAAAIAFPEASLYAGNTGPPSSRQIPSHRIDATGVAHPQQAVVGGRVHNGPGAIVAHAIGDHVTLNVNPGPESHGFIQTVTPGSIEGQWLGPGQAATLWRQAYPHGTSLHAVVGLYGPGTIEAKANRGRRL